MRVVNAVLLASLVVASCAAAEELIFFDNFNDGNLDGWVTFGHGGSTHSVWCEDSELWGRASTGSDCSFCGECAAMAVVDDLVVRDFTIEVKITNHNACGGFGLWLRTAEETWANWSDLSSTDYWLVYFDPGLSHWGIAAKVGGVWGGPGIVEGILSFGTGTADYFRVVLVGESMELWHRPEGAFAYSLVGTLNAPGGSTEGYVALGVIQSAKRASFDDVVVYSHETPVGKTTWGRVKCLYR